jgi:hypothetical protein
MPLLHKTFTIIPFHSIHLQKHICRKKFSLEVKYNKNGKIYCTTY